METAGPSGQRVGLVIRRSRVRIPLWPLAGFVLGPVEFSSSAIQLINSQLVASSVPVGVFNPVMLYLNYSFLSI